jgi:hypothetical protein
VGDILRDPGRHDAGLAIHSSHIKAMITGWEEVDAEEQP